MPTIPPPRPDLPFHLFRSMAITSYANVEHSLCVIFGALLGTHVELASIVFYSITNTHSRNRILDELLEKRFGKTYDAYWNGIAGTPNKKGMFVIIRQLDQSRNEIVHWQMTQQKDASGGTQLVLSKPKAWPFFTEPDVRTITVIDLTEFVQKADFVHRSLNIFFTLIGPSGLAPGHDTLREIFQRPALYPPEDTNPLSRNYKAPENPPQSSGA